MQKGPKTGKGSTVILYVYPNRMKKRNNSKRSTREKRVRISPEYIWGIHPVYEALVQESDRMIEIILIKEKRGLKWEEIINEAKKKGIKLTFVDNIKLTGENASEIRHQGIVAKMSHVPLLPFNDLVENFKKYVKRGDKPRIIVCDSLQDPHNVGAIIRSAYASGAMGVLLTSEKSAPLSGTAAKTSAGAISHIDISQVTNLANALDELKNAGAWVFGAVKDSDTVSLYEADLRVPACIVVGSEGKGIRTLVKKKCDVLVSIPMQGGLDSLNSSVAAAIILFESLRQNGK